MRESSPVDLSDCDPLGKVKQGVARGDAHHAQPVRVHVDVPVKVVGRCGTRERGQEAVGGGAELTCVCRVEQQR